jgi:hypothetical protein
MSLVIIIMNIISSNNPNSVEVSPSLDNSLEKYLSPKRKSSEDKSSESSKKQIVERIFLPKQFVYDRLHILINLVIVVMILMLVHIMSYFCLSRSIIKYVSE